MDRPILFSAPMVRALLEDRKTQTRRVLSSDKPYSLFNGKWADEYVLDPGNQSWRARDVRFAVGDRLWVREAWRAQQHFDGQSPADICAEFQAEYGAASCPAFYEADKKCDGHSIDLWQQSPPGRLRASMHMPRCASRLTLIVTDVRVQRLREINREDAIAEGLIRMPSASALAVEMGCDWGFDGDTRCGSPVSAYAALWDTINAPRGFGWDANPWVAAVTFTVERRNIDQVPA